MRIHKDKVSAILRKAVTNGEIIKPQICEHCGKTFEKRKLYGHHNDYLKPLEVKWLCWRCHSIIEHQIGNKTQFVQGFDLRRIKNSKLTPLQVLKIKEKIKLWGENHTCRNFKKLGEKFKVSRECIQDIYFGRTWQYI